MQYQLNQKSDKPWYFIILLILVTWIITMRGFYTLLRDQFIYERATSDQVIKVQQILPEEPEQTDK